jgi:hypothetical protein
MPVQVSVEVAFYNCGTRLTKLLIIEDITALVSMTDKLQFYASAADDQRMVGTYHSVENEVIRGI